MNKILQNLNNKKFSVVVFSSFVFLSIFFFFHLFIFLGELGRRKRMFYVILQRNKWILYIKKYWTSKCGMLYYKVFLSQYFGQCLWILLISIEFCKDLLISFSVVLFSSLASPLPYIWFCILGMTSNCIWWWGSSSGDLIISITPKSTLI